MRKGTFITVRSASSRLPNKCYEKINGVQVISHIIERAKKIQNSDEVILCTTENKEDDRLCEIALNQDIKVFRGSVKDKLMRWKGASDKFEIDYFVTFDADDLFCEPYLNELALDQIQTAQLDFIHSTRVIPGAFTYCIAKSALDKVCEIKDTEDTEMMWVFFLETGLFKVAELSSPILEDYFRPNVRITLDYPEDLLFFKKIYDEFLNSQDFSLKEILKFLDENPEIPKINYFRDVEWENNQIQKTSLKLKS